MNWKKEYEPKKEAKVGDTVRIVKVYQYNQDSIPYYSQFIGKTAKITNIDKSGFPNPYTLTIPSSAGGETSCWQRDEFEVI